MLDIPKLDLSRCNTNDRTNVQLLGSQIVELEIGVLASLARELNSYRLKYGNHHGSWVQRREGGDAYLTSFVDKDLPAVHENPSVQTAYAPVPTSELCSAALIERLLHQYGINSSSPSRFFPPSQQLLFVGPL